MLLPNPVHLRLEHGTRPRYDSHQRPLNIRELNTKRRAQKKCQKCFRAKP